MSSPIGDAHNRAMELADEGLELRRQGEHEAAFSKFEEAFQFESKAADEISDDLQPGHGVLHRSAVTLALDANRIDEAAKLIQAGLDGGPIHPVREELEELRQFVVPNRTLTRVGHRPATLLQHTIDSLRLEFPGIQFELEESGRLVRHWAELQLRGSPPLLIYRDHSEFELWKNISFDPLPPRLRLYVEVVDTTGDNAQIVGELYGSTGSDLERSLVDVFDAPPENFDFPTRRAS